MPNGNVGDDLNEYVWNYYLNVNAIPSNECVIGIGSLLNHNIPKFDKYTVLSSGVGYGDIPNINEDWNVVAVRGKISMHKLSASSFPILLDGAYLLSHCYPPPKILKKYVYGYIPHVESMELGNWHTVCEQAGIHLIDPKLSLDQFIEELVKCENVFCEAMHGAILADVFSVPWMPVKAYLHINTEKWNDWLSVFDTKASFQYIKGVWYANELTGLKKIKNTVKKIVLTVNSDLNITQPMYDESTAEDVAKVVSQLKALKRENFQLNSREDITAKVRELEQRIYALPYAKN